MTTTLDTPEKESHSITQAKAQVSSILEMVRALEIETAAEDFVKGLDASQILTLFLKIQSTAKGVDEDGQREGVADAIARGDLEPKGFEFNEDDARQTIMDDPLSVQVRSGWSDPGAEMEPEEFMILLCTGGPAVRLVGDLGQYNEPENVRVEHQDWFTPWAEYRDASHEEDEALLTYCRQFLGLNRRSKWRRR